jgi:hypothetical protein
MPPDPGAALFALVEADQGYAFISDGVEGMTVPQLRALVEDAALPAARRVVTSLEKWLRDNPPDQAEQWSLGG